MWKTGRGILEVGGLQQNDFQGGIKGWCGFQRTGAIILWNNGLKMVQGIKVKTAFSLFSSEPWKRKTKACKKRFPKMWLFSSLEVRFTGNIGPPDG